MGLPIPTEIKKQRAAEQQAFDEAFNRTLSAALSGSPLGQESSNPRGEVKSFNGWNYLGITAIARQAARSHHYVYDGSHNAKSKRAKAKSIYGSKWRNLAQDGAADVVDESHWCARLVSRPGGRISIGVFIWEYIQQMHLHGACIIWNRRSIDGSRIVQRLIIPMSIAHRIMPGEDRAAPNGGVEIKIDNAGLGWYARKEFGALVNKVIPVEQLSVVRYPHAQSRGDGQSPSDAAGWWIDLATMVDMTRWRHMKRGPKPHALLTFDDPDIDEEKLNEVEKRMNRKFEGDRMDEKWAAIGGGAKIQSTTTPKDMKYEESFDQIGRVILATHGAGAAMVGLTDNMTHGSISAAITQANTVVQADLDLLGEDFTLLFEDFGQSMVCEFETQPMDDPAVVETQLTQDLAAGCRLGKEWRAIRGLPPFGDWRDDARVTSTGFVRDEDPENAPTTQARPEMVLGRTDYPAPKSMSKSAPKSSPKAERVKADDSPIVAVDLDGTLAVLGKYDPDMIGEPIRSSIEVVRKLDRAGVRICIFTCRDNDELVRQWLEANRVPFDALNENLAGFPTSGKIYADAYFDDRAVNVDEGLKGIAHALGKEWSIKLGENPHKLGAIMLEVPAKMRAAIKGLQGLIPAESVAPEGLEEWPHVTVLYGITGTPIEEVVAEVRKIRRIEVSVGDLGFFNRDNDSVAKLAVESDYLRKINGKLSDSFPVETHHPEYNPHITLGYVRNDGASYSKVMNRLRGEVWEATHAVVSVDGRKIRVPLVHKPETVIDRMMGKTAYSNGH